MSRLLVPEDAPKEAGVHQFEMEGWVDTAPFERLLKMDIREAADGRAYLVMPFSVKLSQGRWLAARRSFDSPRRYSGGHGNKIPVARRNRFCNHRAEGSVPGSGQGWGGPGPGPGGGAAGDETLLGRALVLDENDFPVAEFEATFRIARGQGFSD